MSSFTTPLKTEFTGYYKDGRKVYRLLSAFTYNVGSKDSKLSITVPKGFLTDFASTPKFLHFLFPPDGPWRKASVLHDYFYAYGQVGRGMADYLFFESLRVGEPGKRTNLVTAYLFYLGVRLAGWKWYGWGKKLGVTPKEPLDPLFRKGLV